MAIIQGHHAVAEYLADAAKSSAAALPPPPGTGAKRQRMNSFSTSTMGKAAKEGDLARVREAVDMNPTSTSTMGKAAEEGDLARVREAVEAGEDVNQVDPARVSAVAFLWRSLLCRHSCEYMCVYLVVTYFVSF